MPRQSRPSWLIGSATSASALASSARSWCSEPCRSRPSSRRRRPWRVRPSASPASPSLPAPALLPAVLEAAPARAGSTIGFAGLRIDTMTLLCLLLFVGAMGKSAQLGLHTWLPDAMEGPTPVSALIHAAPTATAGVFMVCRLSPMFEASETGMGVVTLVGAATALFAATVGTVQNDIKRVIAYSTCSQLGYMFFAAGVGAYGAAMFHLFTHAFFKALLFLGAGSVIHAMHHEQDMRFYGGLRKEIPFTFWVMLIGTLAITGVGIVGVAGFAGFWSKDAILESAYASGTTHGGIA